MLSPDERKIDEYASSASLILDSQEFKPFLNLNITRSRTLGRKLIGFGEPEKQNEIPGGTTQLTTLQRFIHALNNFIHLFVIVIPLFQSILS